MFHRLRQKGVVTLIITLVILSVVTIITLFTARVIVSDQRLYKNSEDKTVAYNAAQAGMDYALGNINKTPNAYLSIPDGTILTGVLQNGARYSVKYAYVTPTDSSLISLQSTGYSVDSSATTTVQATIKRYSKATVIDPVISVGNVTMQNTSTVKNTVNGVQKTVRTRGTITFKNTAGTFYTNSSGLVVPGSSKTIGIKADITQNDVSLPIDAATLENNYLKNRVTDFSALAAMKIDCTGTATFDWNSNDNSCTCNGASCTSVPHISGSAGEIIYIDMHAHPLTFNNQFVLGASNAPITLVIHNASLTTISGSGSSGAVINGSVFSDSPVRVTSNGQVKGLLFSSSNLTISGNASTPNVVGAVIAGSGGLLMSSGGNVAYNAANIADSGDQFYGVVAGSWKDF